VSVKAGQDQEFANQHSGAIICVSQSVYRAIQAYLDSQKIHIVYNPVPNLESYRIIEHTPINTVLILGFVGNITPHKRPQDAIKTLALVREAGIDARLLIAGKAEENYLIQLHKLTNDLGVADFVQWLGFVDNMSLVYKQIDIYISCSYGEGFSLAVIEAMASACAIVATRQGGSSEIIEHAVNGFLFDAEDVDELSKYVLKLADDLRLLAIMQQKARESVIDTYTLASYIDQLETILRSLLKSKISTH